GDCAGLDAPRPEPPRRARPGRPRPRPGPDAAQGRPAALEPARAHAPVGATGIRRSVHAARRSPPPRFAAPPGRRRQLRPLPDLGPELAGAPEAARRVTSVGRARLLARRLAA